MDLYLRKDEYDDTVFLIDEPELHINTSIQRKLLIEIDKLVFDAGKHVEKLNSNYTYSYYLLDGEISINDELVEKDSFVVFNEIEDVIFSVDKRAVLFVIKSPSEVNYKRFLERYQDENYQP